MGDNESADEKASGIQVNIGAQTMGLLEAVRVLAFLAGILIAFIGLIVAIVGGGFGWLVLGIVIVFLTTVNYGSDDEGAAGGPAKRGSAVKIMAAIAAGWWLGGKLMNRGRKDGGG